MAGLRLHKSHVELGGGTATLHLPVSKADIGDRGKARTLPCICAIEALADGRVEGIYVCPACAVRKQVGRIEALSGVRADQDEALSLPLFPTADMRTPSKAGVVSIVQTTAYQTYGSGVRINAICPGLIETGMTKPTFDRARERGTEDKIGQINPMKRFGQPNEIGEMACFLLSDRASYVNGQAVPVDGGLSSSHPWVYPRS